MSVRATVYVEVRSRRDRTCRIAPCSSPTALVIVVAVGPGTALASASGLAGRTVPAIDGGAVFAGGGSGSTAEVAAEVDASAGLGSVGVVDVSFAVSTTSMVAPTSADVSRKVDPVGLVGPHGRGRSAADQPLIGDRDGRGGRCGVACAVSVWPSCAVPEMRWGAVTGVAPATPTNTDQLTTVARRQPTIAATPRTSKNLFMNPVRICPYTPAARRQRLMTVTTTRPSDR